jgi:hypothetical protein
LKNTLTEY